MSLPLQTRLLLNAAHAVDHLVLLIFASAVSSMAAEFGMESWQDLMPYTAGAFLMFGLGSIPSGRLGDFWGRRPSMLLFFFGTGLSCMLVPFSPTPISLAIILTIMGSFASIYHPVGIPMLLRSAEKPGRALGWNNLAGNLGVAGAAIVTGYLVSWFGWEWAFIIPGALCMVMGILFHLYTPKDIAQATSPKGHQGRKPMNSQVSRILLITLLAACSTSIIFNITTNSNTELLRERLIGLVESPTDLGMILAAIYVVAAFTQVVVGRLCDRVDLRPLFLFIVSAQFCLLLLASQVEGWWFILAAIGFMASVFGVIPFTDIVVVRYVDDSMRSRVTGLRIGVAFVIGSSAVALLGPLVKNHGFTIMLIGMACISLLTWAAIYSLPEKNAPRVS